MCHSARRRPRKVVHTEATEKRLREDKRTHGGWMLADCALGNDRAP